MYTEASDAYDYYKGCELIDLSESIATCLEKDAKRILISEFLPWGYLYSDFRNGSMTTWRTTNYSERLVAYYEHRPENFPDVIIVLNDEYGKLNGLDGGGVLNYQCTHKGDIWEMIKDANAIQTEIGSIFWY